MIALFHLHLNRLLNRHFGACLTDSADSTDSKMS